MDTEIEIYAESIRQTLRHAKSCWQVWWILNGENPERERVEDIYCRYPFFFETVNRALFHTLIMKLTSPFSESQKDVSLKKLEGIERHPDFATIWSIGRDEYKHRNKAFAHRDVEFVAGRMVLEPSSLEKLKTLLDNTCGLFDDFLSDKGFARFDSYSCENETHALIQSLHNDQESGKWTLDYILDRSNHINTGGTLGSP